MKTVIVEVRGGVVQEVYTNARDLRVVVLDWDDSESSGAVAAGKAYPKIPLSEMPLATRKAVAFNPS